VISGYWTDAAFPDKEITAPNATEAAVSFARSSITCLLGGEWYVRPSTIRIESVTSPLDGKQVYQAYLRRAKNRRDRYLEVYGDGWEGGYWEPIGPRFHLDLVESPS
jgi:hypothetical protein